MRVFDAAVEKAYGGNKKSRGSKFSPAKQRKTNSINGCRTTRLRRSAVFGRIKGPLTTPVGGGIRSLNVALRQLLDLFGCLRPVEHFKGVPSPVKHPEKVNMVIFRENTEDIYASISTPPARLKHKIFRFSAKGISKGVRQDPFRHKRKRKTFWKMVGAPEGDEVCVGIGIKPVSYSGSVRLIHSAISYAIQNRRKSVTLVHKGNIMKFTEGRSAIGVLKLPGNILAQKNLRRPVVQDSHG